jgi:serine/threonine protein kinase
LQKMLHYDPAHRIRVADIARHPWITQPVMNNARITEQIERNIEKNKKKSETPNQKLRSMANKGLLTKIKKYSNPTPKKKSSKQTNSLVRST